MVAMKATRAAAVEDRRLMWDPGRLEHREALRRDG